MKIALRYACLIYLLSFTSCVTVTELEIEPEAAGIIMISPPRDADAREKAMDIMRGNCGQKTPKIVKEGYVKVGSTTTSKAETLPTKQKIETTEISSTTVDLSEWRIHYRCF